MNHRNIIAIKRIDIDGIRKMDTRASGKIYLLEYDESQIVGSKLPSNGQVLKVLFYNMRKVKLDLRSSAYLVIKEAEIIWNKARIPVRQIDRSVQKVEALYQQWKNLQKTCKRSTPLQKRREDEFIKNMNNLFDIAHGNALDLIKIEEDKEFLKNQRKEGRPGAMVGCDRSLLEKEKRRNIRIEKEVMRKEKQGEEQFQVFLTANDLSDNTEELTDESDNDDNTDQTAKCNSQQKNRKRAMKHFITSKLVATLDKCKVSDRDAVRILIAAAEALDHDISTLVISKTSIRLCRKQFRSETAANLMMDFKNKNINQITVHWDGKILPSITGNAKVDRLPVVITTNGIEHLLGVPALSAGTGKEQTDAILKLLNEWNLTEKVFKKQFLITVNINNILSQPGTSFMF